METSSHSMENHDKQAVIIPNEANKRRQEKERFVIVARSQDFIDIANNYLKEAIEEVGIDRAVTDFTGILESNKEPYYKVELSLYNQRFITVPGTMLHNHLESKGLEQTELSTNQEPTEKILRKLF